MITDADESYIGYLNHLIGDDGIDQDVVRATLHQLGYSESKIRSMMGERDSLSSTSLSSILSNGSNGTSPMVGGAMALTAAADIPLHAVPTPRHRGLHRVSSSSTTSSSLCTSAPFHSTSSAVLSLPLMQANPPSAEPSAMAVPPTRSPIKEATPAGSDSTVLEGSETARGDGGALNREGVDAVQGESEVSPEQWRRWTQQLDPMERYLLARWMDECNDFFLSTPVPPQCRSGEGKAEGPPAIPEKSLDSTDSKSGGSSFIDSQAGLSGESFNEDLHERRGVREGRDHGGKPRWALSKEYARSEESESIDYEGYEEAPHCTVCHLKERPHWLVRHVIFDSFSAASPAIKKAQKYTVPRAKSHALIPTCDGYPSNRCVRNDRCCSVTAGRCRAPHQEAQNLRIARTLNPPQRQKGKKLLTGGFVGRSTARARAADEIRCVQSTVQAMPTTGRRIPVMHQPVRQSIYPRGGLGFDRLASTLHMHSKTDRVQRALQYERYWRRRELGSDARCRAAVWDTRYALLSCSN